MHNPNSYPITNFPKHYGVLKRGFYNLIHYLGDLLIHRSGNYLTKKDLKQARSHFKCGDLVLVGGLRLLSSSIINGPVTHALIYLGAHRFIHATSQGVSLIKLKSVFKDYDTLMILRHPDMNKTQSKVVLQFLKEQLGKPYDFEFSNAEDRFYCSDLAYQAYSAAGLDLELPPKQRYLSYEAIHPMDYTKSNLQVVFLSHNLDFKGGRLVFLG
jgi:uncharacterized protein YycO